MIFGCRGDANRSKSALRIQISWHITYGVAISYIARYFVKNRYHVLQRCGLEEFASTHSCEFSQDIRIAVPVFRIEQTDGIYRCSRGLDQRYEFGQRSLAYVITAVTDHN